MRPNELPPSPCAAAHRTLMGETWPRTDVYHLRLDRLRAYVHGVARAMHGIYNGS